MTLPERGVTEPTVSVGHLLAGADDVGGDTDLALDDLIELICQSGLPGSPRSGGRRASQAFLDGYLARLFDHEVEMVSTGRRQSVLMRQWATSYAAATATTASFEKLRDAASPGEADKPARDTAASYRELLTRLWFLDPLEAWLPTGSRLNRLGQAPKHFLADPAFAARLLRLTSDQLRSEAERHATVIGQLWESLAAMSVRVFAQAHMADVRHLRTQGGEHEIDLIIEGDDGRLVAAEVKLQTPVEAREVRHLHWLRDRLGDDRIASLVVITAGQHAYTRPDGIHVVPLALLGP
jgi:predicted AAA+ superfamily ATPase